MYVCIHSPCTTSEPVVSILHLLRRERVIVVNKINMCAHACMWCACVHVPACMYLYTHIFYCTITCMWRVRSICVRMRACVHACNISTMHTHVCIIRMCLYFHACTALQIGFYYEVRATTSKILHVLNGNFTFQPQQVAFWAHPLLSQWRLYLKAPPNEFG